MVLSVQIFQVTLSDDCLVVSVILDTDIASMGALESDIFAIAGN